MNGASNCPECGSRMAIKATNHGGGVTFRIAECDCGERWELEERQIRRLRPCTAVHSHAPPPKAAKPHAEPRGVGGALPGIPQVSGSISKADQTRARTKREANPDFVLLRNTFVERWELKWTDKYVFTGRDASALGGMLKAAPHLTGRWAMMISRYFVDGFWASKRNPLWALCANAGQYAGDTPANGVRTAPSRSDGNVEVLSEFLARGNG